MDMERQQTAGTEHKDARPSSRRASSATESEGTREQGTLYDAVAGRLDYEGFICYNPRFEGQPSKPEEVLFRRKHAPERSEENDPYLAHRDIPEGHTLPSSDLLKALHAYVSDYYAALAGEGNSSDFKSFDETALIALGILLEEATREALGKTGDLAFIEETDAKT